MARYVPANIADPALRAEFDKIAQAVETANPFIALDAIYALPKKFREGTIVLAKAPLNLGSGDGVYCYRGGAWRFLG